MTSVLVLGGGPDAERTVSETSANAVAQALATSHDVHFELIDRIDVSRLAALPGDVIFPVLHGSYGEGGPLQDTLNQDGRPYVGSGAAASRACMDKIGTKLVAASHRIGTPPAGIYDPRDDKPPMSPPFVVKPTHDGSSVGLYLCHSPDNWLAICDAVRTDIATNPYRSYMIERLVIGRELTVGLIGSSDKLEALPIVEIAPASGVYDFQAKYERNDTRYIVSPELPAGISRSLAEASLQLAEALGVRDLARVDFVLDRAGDAWLLEINTMPGFTPTSLLPKAAHAAGLSFDQLCCRLVSLAQARTQICSGD